MVAIQILSLAALAIGTLATPLTTQGPFRIGITFPNTETLYLTATQTASPTLTDGIQCLILSSKLSCGPDNKAFTYSSLHSTSPLKLVTPDDKNVGWSIAEDGRIQWMARQGEKTEAVTFSREKGKDAKRVFAEVCSSFGHHEAKEFEGNKAVKEWWENGVARAYFV